MTFRFIGIGFAVNGEVVSEADKKYVVRAEMFIDGKSAGTIDLPSDYRVRNPTPFWAYGLRPGPHEVLLRILNPTAQAKLALQDVIIYSERK